MGPTKSAFYINNSLQAQFNKRQTGSYPEAVTLATEDARQVAKSFQKRTEDM